MLFTFKRVDVFPSGTTVEARKAALFGVAGPTRGTAPPGAVETSAVSDGVSIGPFNLTDNTEYVFSGQVGGVWNHVLAYTSTAASAPGGSESVAIVGAVDTELPAAAALSDTDPNPTVPQVGALGQIWESTGAVWKRLRSMGNFTVESVAAPAGPLVGVAEFDGVGWSRRRMAAVFKALASTAITAGTGATIWTPAAGKKFRVLGLAISSSGAGQLILGDNAVGTVIARSPALAAGGIWQVGNADIENGLISALANNVLKIDGPTGNIAGMVWGTEE